MGAPLADGADLAGAEGVTLPEHVRRNRAHWDAMAGEYVAHGEESWATDQPRWGIWGIPETEARRRVLAACEATMERLAKDSRYFADPAKSLFSDIRYYYPIREQERVYHVVETYIAAALEFMEKEAERAVTEGAMLRCRAQTRKAMGNQAIFITCHPARKATTPKSAMKPASVSEHPIVGQSQSCEPCFSACTGHAGALSCKGQFAMPACSAFGSCASAIDTIAIATTCHATAIAAIRTARLRMSCMMNHHGLLACCRMSCWCDQFFLMPKITIRPT